VTLPLLPKLNSFPQNLPIDGAVRIELQEGVPILRASASVQSRIEVLLTKQQEMPLTSEENEELDRYEEVDDYLSFVNRAIRNLQHQSST
jgi:phosphoglycerate-specific signal transduction histidine kinase